MRRLLAVTTAFASLSASAAIAAFPPRFGEPQRLATIGGIDHVSAAADSRGGQLVLTSGQTGVTVLGRDPAGPWTTSTLPDFAPGRFYGRISVAAAGHRAAAIALTQLDAMSGGRTARVWARNPGAAQIEHLGTLSAAPGHHSFDPAVAVDASGRVVAPFRTAPAGQDIRGPNAVAVAVREPGGQFGTAQLLTPPDAGAPVVATSPAGRALVAWQHGGNIGAVSVERGTIGRAVVLRRARGVSEPVAAVGPRGEAVVAWTELTPGRRGHSTVMAAYRGRRGRFRPATTVGRIKMLVWNNPAVAVDRDGDAVVAWGWRVPTRGGTGHRDGIDARIASETTGRFSSLRHVESPSSVSEPSAAAAGAGVVLSWSVRERGRGSRVVRAATVREGSISRPANVGALRGSGSDTALALSRGPAGVSLLWPNRGLGMRPWITCADAESRSLMNRSTSLGRGAADGPAPGRRHARSL